MDPYRDPAKMSETALMKEAMRLREQVKKLRGSVRRAWGWACLWVCVCGSIVIIQHMLVRLATEYPKASATACVACPATEPPCPNGCRRKADITCEEFRKLLVTPPSEQ